MIADAGVDGGCLIVADATGTWLNVLSRAALVNESGRAQHAFVLAGDWCLDGNGVTGRAAFLRRWRKVEG